MSKKYNEAKIESTMKLLELNDEQKIKCAVRAISGEPVKALALEYGVGEDIIQAWVDRVGDMVEDNELDDSADLEKKIAAAKAVCYHLQRRIEAERKQVEKREIELRMVRERPPFMQ